MVQIHGGEAAAEPSTSLVTKNGVNAHKIGVETGLNRHETDRPEGLRKRPRCPSPVLFKETCGHGNVKPWERPCDKWTCANCCAWRVETEIVSELVRALQWARRKGWTLKFMTFTWRSADLAADTTKAAAERRRKDVAHFAQWFRRKYGFFEYERIAENHESGKVHFHMVAVCEYVPQAVLSDQWKKLCLSIQKPPTMMLEKAPTFWCFDDGLVLQLKRSRVGLAGVRKFGLPRCSLP